MAEPEQPHRLSSKLWLALLVIAALAVLVFSIQAYRHSVAPVRGSAGPLTEDQPASTK